VSIPAGASVIDARGKTILPGLWDMHGHVSQIEWAPAYLAAGVTSVRDMGGEARFLTALRSALGAGAPGPRLLVAGLIDGPGPNGFGNVIARTPDEGRTLVDSYHHLGFEQIKLYGGITAPVAGAVIRRAHEVGMTVTGHVPAAMGLRAVVDSGMDNVAHLPFRGDESPNEMQDMLQRLSDRRTVMDPTLAWNELLGRTPSRAIAAFEPGIAEVASPLALNYASVQNNVDAAGAAVALARGLAVFKALHDAKVPIIAGTDGGVPGYSLLRAVELSVAAGLTPLEAIRTATIVPARVMGMDREVGTIEAGKVADLVLLDADPLEDIANIRRATSVVRGGRMYETRRLSRLAGFRAQGGDAFSNVRCGSDPVKALIGGRMPNGRSTAIEAAHANIKLKDVGGSDIGDGMFLGGWRMCEREYQILVRRDRIEDVVQLPVHSRRQPAFLGSCAVNGTRVSDVLAVLDNPSPRRTGQPRYAPDDTTSLAAVSAWRIDDKSHRITVLGTSGLRCPRGGIFTVDGGT
jgi:imidazolonepropionase-like amidohydrolase